VSTTAAGGSDGRPVSLTEKVANDLRAQISSEHLAPASALPSEGQLAKDYAVSVTTVRRALEQLRKEGLVQTTKGQRTFVRRSGDWPSHTHSRTISVDADGNYVDTQSSGGEWRDVEAPHKYQISADANLSLALGIPQGTEVYVSDRLLENDAGTRICVRTFLPATVAKELRGLARRSYISARQTYKVAKAAGMKLDLNDYVHARPPTPSDARLLRIPDGFHMLVTRRIASHGDQPVLIQETRRSAEDTELHYRPRIGG
jgi:DNA-binding GntR family transcriptional regulator